MPPRVPPADTGALWLDPVMVGGLLRESPLSAATAVLLRNCRCLDCQGGADTMMWVPYTHCQYLSECIASGKKEGHFMRLLFHMYVYIIYI